MVRIKIRTVDKLSVPVIEASMQAFAAVTTQLASILVDRGIEIQGAMLALLLKEHVLLDGPFGIAKSRLAEELFSRIRGARLFSLQLMKGTQPDELFGPLDSKQYRDLAIWRRNVSSMLPDCHFAFLDEVYRASDMLLPSMMSILNERIYRNGTLTIRCPLRTAIATTNFVTDKPELDAIHDRWLCRIQVKPLASSESRFNMLLKEYKRLLSPECEKAKIGLSQLFALSKLVRKVRIEEEVIRLYEDLVSNLRSRLDKHYVSDRRLVKSLGFAQASFLLNSPYAALDREPMSVEALTATSFGLVKVNDEKQMVAFTEAYEQVVGAHQKYVKETEDIKLLEKACRVLKSNYDDSLSKKDLTELLAQVQQLMDGITTMPIQNQPIDANNKAKLQTVISDLTMLFTTLTEKLEETKK